MGKRKQSLEENNSQPDGRGTLCNSRISSPYYIPDTETVASSVDSVGLLTDSLSEQDKAFQVADTDKFIPLKTYNGHPKLLTPLSVWSQSNLLSLPSAFRLRFKWADILSASDAALEHMYQNVNSQRSHRRGGHIALPCEYGFGGSRSMSGSYANSSHNANTIQTVFSNPAIQSIVTFIDRGLCAFFPKSTILVVAIS
ncbi:hypothetical protein BT96DRAFT_1006443 [Gymnopus androsaceus JB14]|uniref:Uncharacterized protein n=1 Tax=Gymnopus androsaceus JB14 TaxID=1447944 RepID=A0A6A4GK00_9AGAR|nr:hypothetical protein BT96DRAFT_1006443 [Gymnopus androsaceus JB14]